MQLHRATRERLDGDFGEREEVALGGVQHVGDAAAIAVAGERERALDPVMLGLDPDALLAVIHVRLVFLEPVYSGLIVVGLGRAHRVIIAARGGMPRTRAIFAAGPRWPRPPISA